jgi:nucleoside phosphorylase
VSRALGASASAIGTGTWTIRLAGGRSGVLVETGIGPSRARQAALAAPAAKAWLAMGCAGALVGWLRRGQTIAANEVVVLDANGCVAGRIAAAGTALAEMAARHGMRVLEGSLAGSPAILASAEAKAAAAAASGALVVDMESGALAQVARERAIPFHALRVVLDAAGESLPFGPDLVDERTGSLRIGRAIRTLAPPTRWPAAVRLVRGQRAAVRTLRAMARVLADDGMPEPALAWRAVTA